MTPCVVPIARTIIQNVRVDDLRKIANKCTEYSTPIEVVRYLRRELRRKFPDLSALFLKKENA